MSWVVIVVWMVLSYFAALVGGFHAILTTMIFSAAAAGFMALIMRVMEALERKVPCRWKMIRTILSFGHWRKSFFAGLVGLYIIVSTLMGWVWTMPTANKFRETAGVASGEFVETYNDSDFVVLDYGGRLERIVEERNQLLKQKNLVIIGGWYAERYYAENGEHAVFRCVYLWVPFV